MESRRFRFVEETRVHSEERITAERLVGFALSEGSMQTLLAAGVTEQQVGLDRLRAVATTELGDDAVALVPRLSPGAGLALTD